MLSPGVAHTDLGPMWPVGCYSVTPDLRHKRKRTQIAIYVFKLESNFSLGGGRHDCQFCKAREEAGGAVEPESMGIAVRLGSRAQGNPRGAWRGLWSPGRRHIVCGSERFSLPRGILASSLTSILKFKVEI